MSIDAIKLALEALQDIARQPEGDEQSAQAVAKEVIPLLRAAIEQPRQWQNLTEFEKVNIAIDCGCADVAWMDFADAIEAKLKEKNT